MPFPQKFFPMLLNHPTEFVQLVGLHPIFMRQFNNPKPELATVIVASNVTVRRLIGFAAKKRNRNPLYR